MFTEVMNFRSNTWIFIIANSFSDLKKAKEETLYIYFSKYIICKRLRNSSNRLHI